MGRESNGMEELREALVALNVRSLRMLWRNVNSVGRGYTAHKRRMPIKDFGSWDVWHPHLLTSKHPRGQRRQGQCANLRNMPTGVRALVRKAYRTEASVTFAMGDPVLYTGWIPWYGQKGFIFECETTGGRLYFPWQFAPVVTLVKK